MIKKLIYVFCLLYSTSHAQNPDYEMFHFNKKEGLGQDYVYSVIQDKRNFLWIGTGNGLSRYNGRDIVNFQKTDSLQDNFITSSTLDANGNLIFGHFTGGLTKFNGSNFKSITIEGIDKKIVSLATSLINKLSWGITQDGILLRIDGEKILTIKKPILQDKVINCLAVMNNKILVGTSEGLIIFDLIDINDLTEGSIIESLEWINVTALKVDDANNVWVGTEDAGIFKAEIGSAKFTQAFDGEFSKYYIIALEVDYNELWVGSKRNGAFNIKLNEEPLSFRTFESEAGYPKFINTIIRDTEGSIWLGTVGEGLVQIVKNEFTKINFKNKFGIEDINEGVMISDGLYLFATDKGIVQGIYNKSNSKFNFSLYTEIALSQSVVNFMQYDGDSLLWLSTSSGEGYIYNTRENQLKTLSLPVNSKIEIKCMAVDSHGNVWLSIAGQGVFQLDKNHMVISNLNTTNGFIHNDIFGLEIDGNDNVWFGAKAAGLAILRKENGVMERLSQKEIFPSRDINSIKEDNEGHIWISTDGDGLFEYDGDAFNHFKTDNGLKSMFCGKIVVDAMNNIWITHRDGISKIDQRKLNKISIYSQSKGIFGVNTFYKTLFGDLQGGVWFGSGYELIRYNPDVALRSEEPKPFITDLRFNYLKSDLLQYTSQKDLHGLLPENLRLPHDKNHITFDFVAVSLKKKNSIYYKNKLEGFEKVWKPASKENSATYTNLPHGKYTLLVAASDNLYVWPEELTKYEFNILKPYWERWWFYGLQVLFFISLITVTFYISKKRSKNNRLILSVLVYVCLFLIFEYLQNFIEPFTKDFIGGAPLYRILLNLILALVLFPVEGIIRRYFFF